MITIDREAQIAISNTTVGTYLYVEIYLMVQRRLISFAAISDAIGDVFKAQYRNAVYNAAIKVAESAFAKLNLKQSSQAYRQLKDLASENKIELVGNGRSARYELPK